MHEMLSESARNARNEYMRQYRRDNKEKMREYYRNYREKHKDELARNSAAYWQRQAIKGEYGRKNTQGIKGDLFNDAET